ncbi:MAG: hypothetical protein HYT71_00165 [Candidatus Aenigmarchaeota archaeon]|nr:hypothetical protein [Candidatus Aenigmarchaeota archaeon]
MNDWEKMNRIKAIFFNLFRGWLEGSPTELKINHGKLFDMLHEGLVRNWVSLENQMRPGFIPMARGILYEVLFYCSCMRLRSFFIYRGMKYKFEIFPFYDLSPKSVVNDVTDMSYIKPDFFLKYKGEGFFPPILVDVKSYERSDEQLKKQASLSMKHGFLYQIAYPKIKYPKHLGDWNIRNVCPHCGKLNEYTSCEGCHNQIFSDFGG